VCGEGDESLGALQQCAGCGKLFHMDGQCVGDALGRTYAAGEDFGDLTCVTCSCASDSSPAVSTPTSSASSFPAANLLDTLVAVADADSPSPSTATSPHGTE
jgi:hypothetical protein